MAFTETQKKIIWIIFGLALISMIVAVVLSVTIKKEPFVERMDDTKITPPVSTGEAPSVSTGEAPSVSTGEAPSVSTGEAPSVSTGEATPVATGEPTPVSISEGPMLASIVAASTNLSKPKKQKAVANVRPPPNRWVFQCGPDLKGKITYKKGITSLTCEPDLPSSVRPTQKFEKCPVGHFIKNGKCIQPLTNKSIEYGCNADDTRYKGLCLKCPKHYHLEDYDNPTCYVNRKYPSVSRG